ncbi:MAG: efflux RND transporter periplasmic adaptor subunit, partial [Desulfobacterales bacterium]|nr:efflux RND transporter periplasmic adaptor subunit [Desulfobacterales bacterium]
GYRVVGERFVDEGAMLAPNTPIISILDIGVLTAVIHVIERDYPKVRIGQEAVITSDAYPGRRFYGKVARLAPLMKETSRQARVEIEIINENQLLKPGMFARVLIEFEKRDAVTVVPPGAIVKRGGNQGVFVPIEQKGTVRFVPVTVGVVNEDQVEIVSPLQAKNVVSVGQHLLEDGSAILLQGKVQSR